MRDCHNCQIMLLSGTEPIIEACSNITFLCHQGIQYPEMMAQIKEAKLSIWQNKWSEVYDFTPNKDEEEAKNWSLSNKLTQTFSPSFSAVQAAFKKMNEDRRLLDDTCQESFKLSDLNEEEKNALEGAASPDQYPREPSADLDEYFADLWANILPGMVPSKCAQNREKHSNACLILVALENAEDQFDLKLEQTLLVLVGNLIRMNENRGAKKVSWVEDTRVTKITNEQLVQLKVEQLGPCASLLAIHCCMRANIDEAGKDAIENFSRHLD